MKWKNKIIGHDDVAPDQLMAHPLNWRLHPKYQQDTLKGLIDEVGFIRSVTVNQTTGRVIDGHMRVTLALRNDETTVPVEYVELTEEEEAKALLTIDPVSALSASESANVEELLEQIKTDNADISELLADISERAGINTNGSENIDDPEIEEELERLRDGVKKAVLIEFHADDYDEALSLMNFWRDQNKEDETRLGSMIVEYLRNEKSLIEIGQ